MNREISDERLNAFVDRELDRAEEGALLEAMQRDPQLEQRACELRATRDLVRHAYRDEAPSRGGRRDDSPKASRWTTIAAMILIAVGTVAGWTAHAWQQGDEEGEVSRLARRAGVVAQVASTHRVVLHVSSSAPERLSRMLDDAEDMLRGARAAGRPVAVEIVANNTGLDLLRIDGPAAISRRLTSLRADYPNLTLVACAQTIERLREKGVVVQLLPDTVVATSALDEIVQRIHEGWTYVRT